LGREPPPFPPDAGSFGICNFISTVRDEEKRKAKDAKTAPWLCVSLFLELRQIGIYRAKAFSWEKQGALRALLPQQDDNF